MATLFLIYVVVCLALILACVLNAPGDREILKMVDEDRRREALEALMRADLRKRVK
jgi:hypothetical protein